jgi:hypothetical protein
MGVGRKMMRDLHVRRSVVSVTAPILTADHDVDAASDDPAHVEHAAFVRQELFERNVFPRLLRALMQYIVDGFSIVEFTIEPRAVSPSFLQHPGRGQGVGIGGFFYRPASTIDGFEADERNPDYCAGVWQTTFGSDGEPGGRVFIPRERIIRASWDDEGTSFLGFAPLRSAHAPWKTKVFVSLLDAIRHERMGVAIPMIKLPEKAGDDDMLTARDIAESMSSDERAHIVLPAGFDATWLSGGQNTDMAQAIERANRDIAFNMASGFQLLGLTDSSPGSHALASTQEGQLELLIELHAGFIYEVLNHGLDGFSVVKNIIDLNYGHQEKYPKLVARNLPTRDWTVLLPVVKDLAAQGLFQGGAKFDSFVRRVLKLPRED